MNDADPNRSGMQHLVAWKRGVAKFSQAEFKNYVFISRIHSESCPLVCVWFMIKSKILTKILSEFCLVIRIMCALREINQNSDQNSVRILTCDQNYVRIRELNQNSKILLVMNFATADGKTSREETVFAHPESFSGVPI